MSPKAAKSHENQRKARGLYTPEPVRERVIAHHVNGQSKMCIARQEGLDRETVGRILSQPEAVHMIARQRSRLQSMADEALDVVEQALACDDARLAVPVAIKIIEHVFPKGNCNDGANGGPRTLPEAEAKDQRLHIIAQIIDGDLEKSRMYDLPLPAGMVQIRDELARRLKEPVGE